MTVESLKMRFSESFGTQIKVYLSTNTGKGSKVAGDSIKIGKLVKGGQAFPDLEIGQKMTVQQIEDLFKEKLGVGIQIMLTNGLEFAPNEKVITEIKDIPCKDPNELSLKGNTKVAGLKGKFNDITGLSLRIYDGVKMAEDKATLSSIRKKDATGVILLEADTQVSELVNRFSEEFGLKIQISGSDDSYICDGSKSLAEALRDDSQKTKTTGEKEGFSIDGRKQVGTLQKEFKEHFGLTLRIYRGRKLADSKTTLASIRKEGKTGGNISPRKSMQVGNFEKKIEDLFGIITQVAGSDDSYLCKNELTLAAALKEDKGILAKKRTKAERLQVGESSASEDIKSKSEEAASGGYNLILAVEDPEDFWGMSLCSGPLEDYDSERFNAVPESSTKTIVDGISKEFGEELMSFYKEDDIETKLIPSAEATPLSDEHSSKLIEELEDATWHTDCLDIGVKLCVDLRRDVARKAFEAALEKAEDDSEKVEVALKIGKKELLGDKEWSEEILGEIQKTSTQPSALMDIAEAWLSSKRDDAGAILSKAKGLELDRQEGERLAEIFINKLDDAQAAREVMDDLIARVEIDADGARSLGEFLLEHFSDKETAKELAKKGVKYLEEYYEEDSWEFNLMADFIADSDLLDDKGWAREVYAKSVEISCQRDEGDDLRANIDSISNETYLNDRAWAKELLEKYLELGFDVDEVSFQMEDLGVSAPEGSKRSSDSGGKDCFLFVVQGPPYAVDPGDFGVEALDDLHYSNDEVSIETRISYIARIFGDLKDAVSSRACEGECFIVYQEIMDQADTINSFPFDDLTMELENIEPGCLVDALDEGRLALGVITESGNDHWDYNFLKASELFEGVFVAFGPHPDHSFARQIYDNGEYDTGIQADSDDPIYTDADAAPNSNAAAMLKVLS